MKLIKPPSLQKGDSIAIVAPSSGLAALFPHRLERAVKFLEKIGYKIKVFPTARSIKKWSSGSPKERACDINNAFEDNEVKAIICSIGGIVANQTLKYINFDIIRKKPKIFCGYSDISVLHYAFHTVAGLVTFYGPCAMTQFGEYPEPLKYTVNHFEMAVGNNKPIGRINPSEKWTDEVLDWANKLDIERPRGLKTNSGFQWLREGKVSGRVMGGCISSIVHLRGTKFWPNQKDRIFFIEISEGQESSSGEPLSYVDSYLTNLEISGVFQDINGLIVGRPFRYTNEDTEELKRIILEQTKEYDFPILFGADIGHTDPMITIPLGTKVELDSNSNSFVFLESGTSNNL